jgi:hypothetical protein
LRGYLGGFASPYRFDSERILACEINYEDPALFCEDTDERIPSAYAEEEA